MSVVTVSDFHLYLHQPTPIFKARTNMASATYPITALVFDGVTLGAYTDIQPDMELVLGTTDGGDQLGRVRVQNLATASTIPVGRISRGVEDGTLDVQDNAYITVYADSWKVWAKLPYISPDGVSYKDANVEVNDYTDTDMPPVANCGPGFADYIDPDTEVITVAFDGTGSFAMADGATLTTYAWDVGDGTITVGTSADDSITATFPAGFRWVGLTVTDSNGTQHSSRCPVLAVDPADDPTVKFAVEQHRLNLRGGQTVSFRILEDMPRSTYPDGCLVLFWQGAPSSPSDRSHMRLIGWHQSDSVSIGASKTGLIRDTVLTCVDVAGRLDTLPGFPQALERVDPATTWEQMPNLNMSTCLHYLAFWHSTALSLADFFLPANGSDYPAMRLDSTGASLYDQLNSRAVSMVPMHHLTCNLQGQLRVLEDWMLVDVADRPAVSLTLTEDDWSELRVDYSRPPKVYAVRASAVVCSTDWLTIGGEETLPLAFAIAPGEAFGQGVAEQVQGEQLTITQEALNKQTGHLYARLNARYGLFTISEPSGDVWDYDPANLARVQLNISAATAAQRGLDSTTLVGMIQSIDIRYNVDKRGVWLAPSLTFERETSGYPATTVVPEIADDPDYDTPPPPPATDPDTGLIAGQQQVAGIDLDGNLYRTSDFQTASGSGGPTWESVDLGITETLYSWVVDPFSPGYVNGSGAINGWIATETDIYRVADLFGTVTVDSVLTFATTADDASFHWRTVQASFGAYFAEGANPWLLCISYYGSTVGHTGTWATYSTDGGTTWSSEVQISEFYDNGTLSRFNPIGVYASPKTPGLAYTAAYLHTGSPADADGYVSTDWGATWTALSAAPVDDPAAPLLHWGLLDTSNSFVGTQVGGTFSVTALAAAANSQIKTQSWKVLVAPPANAVRVLLAGRYQNSRTQVHTAPTPAPAFSNTYTLQTPGSTSMVETLTFTEATVNGATSQQDYTVEWTREFGTDWHGNRDQMAATPPTSTTGYCAFTISATAATGGDNESAVNRLDHTVSVIEIELEDGTIYTPPALGAGNIQPGQAQAGSIHLPWESNPAETLAYYGYFDKSTNRQFRLKQSASGTVTDISPSDGTRSYGVNRGQFGVRAHDSNRQKLLAAVMGNDTSSDAADDLHGVYVSDDAGATWTEVVAPMADTGAPTNRPAFEAAWSGDSETTFFIWGPPDTISYSSDGGSTVEDKSGNLSGTSGFVGIAGGIS